MICKVMILQKTYLGLFQAYPCILPLLFKKYIIIEGVYKYVDNRFFSQSHCKNCQIWPEKGKSFLKPNCLTHFGKFCLFFE